MVLANRLPLFVDVAALFVTGELENDIFKDQGIVDGYSMAIWYNSLLINQVMVYSRTNIYL